MHSKLNEVFIWHGSTTQLDGVDARLHPSGQQHNQLESRMTDSRLEEGWIEIHPSEENGPTVNRVSGFMIRAGWLKLEPGPAILV